MQLKLVAVQSLTFVQLFATPWTEAYQASLSFIISQTLFKVISTDSVVPSNHFILFYFVLLLPSIFPSIRVFSNLFFSSHQLAKIWSFSFTISPSNEYSGSISFKTDWFSLLAAQVTLKSLLQHHNSKASILQCSAFFMV